MAEARTVREVERKFAIKCGSWPPDLSALSGLGFDSVSTSKSCIRIKKSQSTDMAGRPHLFCEIELGKNYALLRYSSASESDSRMRQMNAATLFLRVLSLVPALQISAQDFASLVLPALETSSKVASASYEALSKKCDDLRREASELASKNAKLSASSEETASAMLGLERTIAASTARIKKLEAVSDQSLREAVLEWLGSHRGGFSAAAFSTATSIPLARAEEGLEMLLKSGAIRRIGTSFSVEQQESRGAYQLQEKSPLQPVKDAIQNTASSVRRAMLPRKK